MDDTASEYEKKCSWTLGSLAKAIGAKLEGDEGILINGLATLKQAQPGQLGFLANPQYRNQLHTTQASAVIIAPEMKNECSVAALLMPNPYLGYAKASRLFDRKPVPEAGFVHPSAVIAPSARVHASVHIGANVVVEDRAHLSEGVKIGPGCVVGADTKIGVGSFLFANVTLYHQVKIGARCVLHSGVVIGADGFGFANDQGRWEKIAQLGRVCIGDDVEIGAGTTIDRGALDDTVIGHGVILDNQVQIAHNVKIGNHTAIAGCSAIAGSTVIGEYCTIAGAVGVVGHISIADRVHITAMTLVTKSITKAGVYSSGTGMDAHESWKKNAARFRQLDNMNRRIKKLEKK